MVPPGTNDLCPYALSYMSSRALTPFGSEAAVCLVVLSRPVGANTGSLEPKLSTSQEASGYSSPFWITRLTQMPKEAQRTCLGLVLGLHLCSVMKRTLHLVGIYPLLGCPAQ